MHVYINAIFSQLDRQLLICGVFDVLHGLIFLYCVTGKLSAPIEFYVSTIVSYSST